MTTAARPTWDAAKGGFSLSDGSGGRTTVQISVRDLVAHSANKIRQPGQNSKEDLSLLGKDDPAILRAQLEERERAHKNKRLRNQEYLERGETAPALPVSSGGGPLQLTNEGLPAEKKQRVEGEDEGNDDRESIRQQEFDDSDDSDSDSSSDDDDGDDDTEALMAELQKIKNQRAAEKEAKNAEKREEEQRIRTENVMRGNPLLNNDQPDFSVTRRLVLRSFFQFQADL